MLPRLSLLLCLTLLPSFLLSLGPAFLHLTSTRDLRLRGGAGGSGGGPKSSGRWRRRLRRSVGVGKLSRAERRSRRKSRSANENALKGDASSAAAIGGEANPQGGSVLDPEATTEEGAPTSGDSSAIPSGPSDAMEQGATASTDGAAIPSKSDNVNVASVGDDMVVTEGHTAAEEKTEDTQASQNDDAAVDAADSTAVEKEQDETAETPSEMSLHSSGLISLLTENESCIILDFYADWCGPCKQLTPILSDICKKTKGLLLCKVDVDQERNLMDAMQVTGMPTLFGLVKGKVVCKRVGFPNQSEMMEFMQCLMTGTVKEGSEDEMAANTESLWRIASASAFTFAEREKLNTRCQSLLRQLVEEGDIHQAEDTSSIVERLLSNVLAQGDEEKFRLIRCDNAKIKSLIVPFKPAIILLKLAGFVPNEASGTMKMEGLRPDYERVNCVRENILTWRKQNMFKVSSRTARQARA